MARVARKDMHQERPLVRRPVGFIIHCFAERKDDQWQAFTLELGLAAQADSLVEVRGKLESMIEVYVHEALTEDRAHGRALLSRRSTWRVYLKFYWYRFLSFINHARDSFTIFDEPLSVDARICPT